MAISLRKAPVQATARYKFPVLSPDPANPITLIVRHAGETNPSFWNAVIKEANSDRDGVSAGMSALTVDLAAKRRAEAADLFARYVIVGWENVTDNGQPVEFSPEKVRTDLLEPMITPGPDGDWRAEFDAFRAWCQRVDNFRGAPVIDAGVLGKK